MIFTFTLVALHTVFQAVGVPQFTQGEESQGVLTSIPSTPFIVFFVHVQLSASSFSSVTLGILHFPPQLL